MSTYAPLRAKVQAWADKLKDPPTQVWPVWRVKPDEILALIDVAEAAQELEVRDCAVILDWESWHPELPDEISEHGCGTCHACVVRDALKKLPQKSSEDDL